MRSLLLVAISLLAGLGLASGLACNRTELILGEPLEQVSSNINCILGLEQSMLEMRAKFPMDCCKIKAFKEVCQQNGNNERRLNGLAEESVIKYSKEVDDKLFASEDGCSSKMSSHCCYPEKQLRGVKLAIGREVHLSESARRLGTKGVRDLFKHVFMCFESIIYHVLVGQLDEVPQICCGLPIVSPFCPKPSKPTRKPTKKPVPRSTTSKRPTSVSSTKKRRG